MTTANELQSSANLPRSGMMPFSKLRAYFSRHLTKAMSMSLKIAAILLFTLLPAEAQRTTNQAASRYQIAFYKQQTRVNLQLFFFQIKNGQLTK